MCALYFDYEDLRPGQIAFDTYRVLRCLGKGSTSVVYSVCLQDGSSDTELLAALKVLSQEAAKDKNISARFRNEIRVTHAVKHPCVVQGIEFVRNSFAEGFTMELVEGGSLHDLLFDQGKLPIKESIRMLSQLCLGLQAIHDAGIVHRDLKPRNLLITLQHNLKITDFSTALCPDIVELPYDVGRVGTFEYMSPEVLTKGVADFRSDIFAVGVIAYEMITGQLPFESITFSSRDEPQRRKKPRPPDCLRSGCPKTLSSIIMKALAVRPKKRFQSAAEMLNALTELTEDSSDRSFFSRVFS